MVKSFLRWLLFSNVYIAIAAILFTISNLALVKICDPPIVLLLVIFLAVIWFYNLSNNKIRLTNSKNLRLNWLLTKRNHLHTVQTILFSCIVIFCLLLLPNLFNFYNVTKWFHLVFFFSFFIVAFFYLNDFKFKLLSINLRSIGLLKPFFIGYVWMGVTFVLPYVFYKIASLTELNFNKIFYLFFIEGFVFISLLAIIYDVKDAESDKKNGLITWCVKLGFKDLTKKILLPCLFLMSIEFSFLYYSNLICISTLLVFIGSYLTILFISTFLLSKQSLLLHLAVIDGVIIARAIVIILINNL